MKKVIDAMDKAIGLLEKIVLFSSITVMLIVTAIEVLDAKVLHANLMWTTEVNRIMLVWCILSGASVASGTRSHLGVEFLVRKMPKKVSKWVVLFSDLICIFVSGYVVASGIALVSMQIRLGSVYSITRIKEEAPCVRFVIIAEKDMENAMGVPKNIVARNNANSIINITQQPPFRPFW